REIPQDFSPEAITRATDAALRRLKTDRIDLLQLHNIRMEQVYDDALWTTLEKLKSEGKVRYYGIALGPAIGWLYEGTNCVRERGRVSSAHCGRHGKDRRTLFRQLRNRRRTAKIQGDNGAAEGNGGGLMETACPQAVQHFSTCSIPMIEHRHLPHVSSFRYNPIVFFTTCTHKRRRLLACAQSHVILPGLWERSAE